MQLTTFAALCVLVAPLVSAHTFITNIAGANGKNGIGFGNNGMSAATLMDPKQHQAFYHAPRWLKSMPAMCGVNRINHNTKSVVIPWQSDMAAAVKKGLPTTNGDTITISIYQLNKDGGGPFSCEVSPDGQGKTWKPMTMLQNAPGNKGMSPSTTEKVHIVKAKMPSGVKCAGSGGACLGRCKNPNVNAFGGCFAFTNKASSKRNIHARRAVDAGSDEELLD